jgi:GT2 family glycosyltransferase
MSRPAVSVVMPFAGTTAEARAAMTSLLGLERRDGDELIVADNSASVPATPAVTIVSARAERSPAHARNAGAERARNDWILFLDADCRPLPGLLDAYFATPVEASIGALAGGVIPASGPQTLAARYGAARNFLGQEAHLAHPFRPRAAAANLMVRRAAFVQVGGFYEGLRAAEDTDFSWRLQAAGWHLGSRPEARVEHEYRSSVAELRRQWRGYAAGRAWLARRYQGFRPEPAVVRAGRRAWRRARDGVPGARAAGPRPDARSRAGAPPPADAPSRAYLALDALLALDELAGFTLSNRPARAAAPPAPTDVVLVADVFPGPGPAATTAPAGIRVEAARRPDVIDLRSARGIPVDYREDDGIAARASALARLVICHPGRCLRTLGGTATYTVALPPRLSSLASLAPAVLRLMRDPGARVEAADGESDATARRLATLAGAPYERQPPDEPHPPDELPAS